MRLAGLLAVAGLLASSLAFLTPAVEVRRPHALQAKSKTSSDKVRVRLLTDVKDTGRRGEIVLVSPALWSNVLMPKKSAVRVSDEELSELKSQERVRVERELESARAIQAGLAAQKSLAFSRKVGPNRQLFGAVTGKQIIEQLKLMYPEMSAKVGIESVVPEDADTPDALVNGEIRKSGAFRVKVTLHPQVSAEFRVEVTPDK